MSDPDVLELEIWLEDVFSSRSRRLIVYFHWFEGFLAGFRELSNVEMNVQRLTSDRRERFPTTPPPNYLQTRSLSIIFRLFFKLADFETMAEETNQYADQQMRRMALVNSALGQ